MFFLVQLIIFIFGIIIGSFLNSIIWRASNGKSIFLGRSQCVHCDRQLLWRDLVPLASFFFQKGQCRYCAKAISPQYPLVEFFTGVSFLLIVNLTSHDLLNLIFLFFVTSILIILFVSDLRYLSLPINIIIFGAIAGFLFNIFLGGAWYNFLLGSMIGAVFFGLQYLLSRGKWIGEGDIYLGGLIGAVLGFPGVFYATTISYVFGALVAIFLLARKQAKLESKLPLGTFLALGTFITILLLK